MQPVAESTLAVKADFPIFTRRFGGRELIYLDSGATSQ
jgi:selenocysteine lyase/cysteine desulfurase